MKLSWKFGGVCEHGRFLRITREDGLKLTYVVSRPEQMRHLDIRTVFRKDARSR